MDDKPMSQSLEEWMEQGQELPLPHGLTQETILWPAETQR